MKIQGTVTVEGISLRVDIEAPDDTKELYVTNVHPNCLVIPRERWRVEFLGLPAEIVAALHAHNIFTLGELVDNHWNPRVLGLNETIDAKIEEAVAAFRKIALVFERSENGDGRGPTPREKRALPLHATIAELLVAKEEDKRSSLFQNDIAFLGLLKPQEDALRKTKGVRTLGDVEKLGHARLMMTEHMDQKGMAKIEAVFRKAGLSLPP